MADGPSNLTTGQIIDADANPSTVAQTTEQFRNSLLARNLYNSNDSYGENTVTSRISAMSVSLNSVLQVIPQYQSVSLQNSLLSRAGSALGIGGELTTLEKIGTQMLAKQMFYNSVSHLAQNYLGSIDIMRALKGGKLYQKPIDYSITKDANAGLLDKITSAAFFKTNITGTGYPFSNATNVTYIENTGKAQLSKFYEAINYNLYKPLNQKNNDVNTQKLIEYSGEEFADVAVLSQFNVVSAKLENNKPFFNFDDIQQHPYLSIIPTKINEISIFTGNTGMKYSFDNSITDNYAPDIQYVNNYFGKSDKTPYRNDILNYVDNTDRDDIANKLVWGRDGVSENTKNESAKSHGDYDKARIETTDFLNSQFNVRRGILEYTRNLVNATSGQFIDLTRKVFTEGDKVVAFNGSPLWKSNNSEYAKYNRTTGMTGIRQHTMIDQYDRYTKAIRFNGNLVYNGNPNSVVYQSVIPRIFPTRDDNSNEINNKNLMFSIENLAVQTIKRDNYGVIDDEFGSPIPLSEVGPFMGRIMWFPPYDLQLNETATAKYESTVMVGRNEPMYNYMNSERTATLSFTLIVDYPPHLRMYINDPNYKKNIADFFAFGGDALPAEESIVEIQKRITELENEKTKIIGPTVQSEPNITEFSVNIYFPNDLPKPGQENSIVDIIYKNALHYEIIKGCPSQDGSSNGLNKDIYFITGLTKTGANTWQLDPNFETNYPNFSQYTAGSVNQQSDVGLSVNPINDNIKKYLDNPENRPFYKITINGTASKLYEVKSEEAEYNEKLGLRRANAAKYFVESRIKAVLGISDISDIDISISSTGSEGQSAAGASAENMNKPEVKEERSATITFGRNNREVPPKKIGIGAEVEAQQKSEDIKKIDAEISALQTKLNRLRNLKDNIFNPRKINDETNATLNTFESSDKNYYYPAFQTQTPEDFHRRLTFLQQCTRQGAAKRYAMEVDNTGVLRAKNSVFGRQPICILRVGDFFHTKVVIDNVTIDYNDTTWDMNPEGMGMQPMIAKVTLQLKVIGGQSLKGPIDALQNAASFNYYANSTYYTTGMYKLPSDISNNQESYINGVLAENKKNLNAAYEKMINTKQAVPTK